jgi:hypothetical protein
MDEQTLAKLASLKNYHTRYEIAATRGTERVLIGYSARKGRRGILSMAQTNGEKFAEYFQVDALQFGKRATDGATAGEWTVNFSGRTQRDAILSGELPFFPQLLRGAPSAIGRSCGLRS